MNRKELKQEIVSLLNDIKKKDELEMLRDVAWTYARAPKGGWANTLSPAEQRELDESIRESMNPANLIPHEEVMKKTRKRST